MSDTNIKPKEERLKETITILKKLKEIGIPSDHHFYNEIKERMSDWVKDGDVLEETYLLAKGIFTVNSF